MKFNELTILVTTVVAISSFSTYAALAPVTISSAQDTVIVSAPGAVSHTFSGVKNLSAGYIKPQTLVGEGTIKTENALSAILGVKFTIPYPGSDSYSYAVDINDSSKKFILHLPCNNAINPDWDCSVGGAITTKKAVSSVSYRVTAADNQDQSVLPGTYLVSLQAGHWAN